MEIIGWLLPFSLLVIAIISVPVRILDEAGLPRYRILKQELSDVGATNDRLTREVRRLERQVAGLRDDPEAIERIARDEMGMVKPDELVFQFSE